MNKLINILFVTIAIVSYANAVCRTETIARAKVWVEAKVPYSQTATYQVYRTDCSGYVSMAWNSSKPGHTTFNMPDIATKITKDELKAGDVLLNVEEHVVLFAGWANADKTEYVAYEETRPGEGTVTRNDPYPYFAGAVPGTFEPYRYNSIAEC